MCFFLWSFLHCRYALVATRRSYSRVTDSSEKGCAWWMFLTQKASGNLSSSCQAKRPIYVWCRKAFRWWGDDKMVALISIIRSSWLIWIHWLRSKTEEFCGFLEPSKSVLWTHIYSFCFQFRCAFRHTSVSDQTKTSQSHYGIFWDLLGDLKFEFACSMVRHGRHQILLLLLVLVIATS